MKLEEVEKLVKELDPRDRLKLAAGICEQLSAGDTLTESESERRERRLAALARCDKIAGDIDGDFDVAEDLRRIRAQRIADIS